MPRPRFHLVLTPGQLAELESALKITHLPLRPEETRARNRAQALWRSSQGYSIEQIVSWNHTTERTFWRWVKRYREKGLAGLSKPR